MKILSNFKNLPESEYTDLSLKSLWRARKADILVINVDSRALLTACVLLLFSKCRLISVDLHLRHPINGWERLIAWLKGWLLGRVDMFVLYFKNIDGYVRDFGLIRERCCYVSFKVNSYEQLVSKRGSEGAYVLAIGNLRDHETFVQAIEIARIPAVMVVPDNIPVSPWFSRIPDNLRLRFINPHDDETYLKYFENAKIVCIPRLSHDIGPTGISAYLCAMALGKCVMISYGPGAEDVIPEGAAAFFRPKSIFELSQRLKFLWNNNDARNKIALAGTVYADHLRGEDRLLEDILKVIRGNYAEYI